MAPSGKANYKTFDAQARLLRAIVAAHPEVKWNYKEIAECYGSDMTPDALNHRFRKIRAETVIVKKAREKGGLDMKDLPLEGLPQTQGAVDDNIAVYFGQSTGDGIQFQFRNIKHDANNIKDAVSDGKDPQSVPLEGLPTKVTPSKKGAGTPRKPATPSSRKRKTPITVKAEILSDNENEDSTASKDWSEMDIDTPTKKAKTVVQKTPGRGSKTKAAVKLEEAISDPDDSGTINPKSIFGDVSTAFNNGASDAFIGGNYHNYRYDGDGEI